MEVCFHVGFHFGLVHGPQHYESQGSLRRWVAQEDVEFLAYTNAEIDDVKDLPPHRGFHVVRDPRDVLVSAYFSHRNSHPTDQWPELEEHREALQSLSKEDGLLKEVEFSRRFLTAMKQWDYDQDHILEVKMEDLTATPHEQFRRIFRHLDLYGENPGLLEKAMHYGNRGIYKLHHELPVPLPGRLTKRDALHSDVLDSILEAHRFEKLTGGRSKGEADPESHLRKGEPGDWVNHFTERVEQKFQAEYGDIVERLGYR